MKTKNYQLNLKTRVEELYSVGQVFQKHLNRLGIFNLQDLLLHFPVRYEDLSQIKPIIEARPGESATFKGKILSISSRQTKNRRMILTEIIISDDTSTLKAVLFNQPFLSRFLKTGDSLVLAGKVDFKPYLGKYLSNPTYEKTDSSVSLHLGRIVPIYPETKGLTSKWLRLKIKPLLKLSSLIADPLPLLIRERLDLINLDEAIRQIHFPDFSQSLKAAVRRLSFDELFAITLKNELTRHKLQSLKAKKIKFKKRKIADFIKALPFKLTDCQRKTAWEIIQDIGKDKPMNRLLNGDVGSGKTIVAVIAAYLVSLNKKQTAIMSPTETLAIQHYHNFLNFFKNYNIKIELLTSSFHLIHCHSALDAESINKIDSRFRGNDIRGESDILIGTHALIQKNIKFKNLALAIIDEQHRFGVKQRREIKRKSQNKIYPHLLSMTATPIPRTLSLALYGDLDISTLDHLPQGRQKIKTSLVPPSLRTKAYNFIRQETKKGRQIFVICPLISAKTPQQGDLGGPATMSPTETLGGKKMTFDFDNRKAAIEEYKKLKNSIFPDLKIGLLHGRMKSKNKEEIMNKFKKKKLDILVSTSVVEVGVDIPNASVMMIEGADRFGLSQLHQFRGRVGRSKHQSYCLLFSDSLGEETKTRLKIMAKTNDGFKIAEADLKLRGPGEVYGERQHGAANLRFASLFDFRMIEEAKIEAKKIISKDPTLASHPLLLKKLEVFEKETHLE